ncbi:hypothetical protein ACLBXM_00730 [Xanthobacteraceae bacterium A53D]
MTAKPSTPKDKHDKALEDSFPASDPPATGQITGAGAPDATPAEKPSAEDPQQSGELQEELDEELDDSFPASDPPSLTRRHSKDDAGPG